MEGPRIPAQEEILNPKSRKKKSSTQRASLLQQQVNNVKEEVQAPLPLKSGPKGSKRSLIEIPPPIQKPEGSNSDSLADSSSAGIDYRALRRRYLMLEDQNYELGRELREIENEVKILEDEKHALLDELIVMEGLVEPSEKQP